MPTAWATDSKKSFDTRYIHTHMQPIETIVFDLGGVLIDWNPAYLYRKIFDDEAAIYDFLARICTGTWNEQQDAGRPLEEATRILVEQFPEHSTQIQAYYGRWTEMLGGPIPGTVQLLESLHAQQSHRSYALTNWSAETFPHALERYDFLQRFAGILVSGEEKLIKPDPRIYALLLQRFAIQPETALFIDDNPANVAGAQAAGMQAVRFHSPEQLRSEMVALGIFGL